MNHFDLEPGAVAASLAVTDKARLFDAISVRSADAYGFDPAEALAALFAREALGSTGFGHGTAVPHGRVAGLARPVGCVMRICPGIEYAALDGAPVDIVFALFSPPNAGVAHLHALAEISRMMRDERMQAKLRGARDSDALFAVIRGGHERFAA